MKETILTVDIGNTCIKVGLFCGERLKIETAGVHPPLEGKTIEDLLRRLLGKEKPCGSVIASVLPSYNNVFFSILESITSRPPLIVDSSVNTGLIFDVPDPKEIGADRIASAVSAYDRIKGNVAVVDIGSATTITIVKEGGRFTGGAIMPGLNMMGRVLGERTGRLPSIKPSRPLGPLGRDTKNSIIAGIMYGTAGAVERLLGEIAASTGDLVTILTGGDALLLKDLLRVEYRYIPSLTLKGLKLIYERNK